MRIYYRDLRHWKYQVMKPFSIRTPIKGYSHKHLYFEIFEDGTIEVLEGYCWDGPSGPVWHTPSSMRPSLIHDVLYQLLRIGIMSSRHRKRIDDIFYELMIEDGMGKFRAWYFYCSVRMFGWFAAGSTEPYPAVREAP